jgi:hypothetical protein
MAMPVKDSGLRTHFMEVASNLSAFLMACLKSPEITFNAIVSLVICVFALEAFTRTKLSDIVVFTDTSYTLSDTLVSSYPLAVVSASGLATSSTCPDGDRLCKLEYPTEFHPGVSGILAYSFTTFNQNEFSVPHLLAAAMWFSTPISLFLLANETWNEFQQWMWWGLYVIIFFWEVIGAFLLILLNYAPVYNKVLVIVYLIYSTMLMYAVRETWAIRSQDRVSGDQDVDRGKMSSRVPVFLHIALNGVSTNGYRLTAVDDLPSDGFIPRGVPLPDASVVKDSREALAGKGSVLAPEVITHTFTRTVLLLCEFLFIAPVIYISAFVLVQERVIPFEIQIRFWQTSLFFGIIILIEKSRKTCLSYVTESVLCMAAFVSLLAVSWCFVPEIMRALSGIPNELIPSAPGGAVLYIAFIICLVTAVVNLLVTLICVMFLGKDRALLSVFQHGESNDYSETDIPAKNGKSGRLLFVLKVMYYFNATTLAVVKTILLACFSLQWLDNRAFDTSYANSLMT